MVKRLALACALCVGVCGGATTQSVESRVWQTRLVSAARSLLGVPYSLGGRMRTPDDGIDCQGVVFFAAERAGNCGWRSFSTRPTRSVADEELGGRVPGMDPVAAEALGAERIDTDQKDVDLAGSGQLVSWTTATQPEKEWNGPEAETGPQVPPGIEHGASRLIVCLSHLVAEEPV